MTEGQYRLPLFIETNRLTLGEYLVLDIDHRVVQVCDAEEEVEAFVAHGNGCDVETERRETAKRARMFAEPRENLIRHSRERRTH